MITFFSSCDFVCRCYALVCEFKKNCISQGSGIISMGSLLTIFCSLLSATCADERISKIDLGQYFAQIWITEGGTFFVTVRRPTFMYRTDE